MQGNEKATFIIGQGEGRVVGVFNPMTNSGNTFTRVLLFKVLMVFVLCHPWGLDRISVNHHHAPCYRDRDG